MMNFFRDPRRRHGRFALMLLLLFLAAAVGVVCLMDALEVKQGWRKDFSFNGVTTQTEATQAVLRELKEPVHIYALFKKGEEDEPLFELLNRYAAQSPLVTWEQLDVTLNPGVIAKFQGDSNTALTTNSLVVYCPSTDRYKILNSFVSLSYDIDLGGYTLSGLTYEKEISEAIVYVTRREIPPVMILEGHNEWGTTDLSFTYDYLTRNNFYLYQVSLEKGDPLDPQGLLMILSPQVDLSQDEVETIMDFARAGGALFITCDVTVPADRMPNLLSLLRAFGASPREGMVVAGKEEKGTYFDQAQIALLPYMQATLPTRNLIESKQDTLLLALARAFEEPAQTDNSLTVEPVLYSGYQAYLKPLDGENFSIEQTGAEPVGPFPLALLAERLMDSGELSRAFVIGNTTFMTDSSLYATTDNGPFLLKMLEYLLNQETISLNIAAKPAVRPGLSAGSLSLGIGIMVAAPLAVLIAALWVLTPRRNK
ncbi:MAG: Gldg family protein [Clostridia bacterium]|nr:Gldg family protein [Clostridia bacterium]